VSDYNKADGHRSWAEIMHLTRTMQEQRGDVLERMRQIELRYDGDYVIPMPERPQEKEKPVTSPSLMGELIDGMSQRAASVPFMVGVPAVRGSNKQSVKRAGRRRSALQAVYHESKFDLVRRTYYRHLTAYHTFTLMVAPNWKTKMPMIQSRSPLTTFAEQRSRDEMRPPEYVAFVSTRSASYLRAQYPMSMTENGGPISPSPGIYAQEWDIVEWCDETHTRYGILGPTWQTDEGGAGRATQGGHLLQTAQAPIRNNMAISDPIAHSFGVCPVVCPEMPSLGRIAARLSALTGMIDMADKLSALDIEAQMKAVFPDTYIIGDGDRPPTLDGDTWKDGTTGDVNIIGGAKAVGVLRTTPDPRTGQMVSQLERNFRVSTGLAGSMSGENQSGLRTGRAIDSIMSASVDPRIAEMHDMTAAWVPHIQEIVIRGFKEYWPSKTYSLYTGNISKSELVEFTPKDDCDDPDYRSTVSYPVPGADMIQLTQVLGSLAGANTISQETMRELHPWVRAPEDEKNQIFAERIEQSLVESLMQRAASGELPIDVGRQVLDELRSTGDISKAIQKVEEFLRKQQAAQPPPVPEGMGADPSQMPGLEGGPGANQAPLPGEVASPGDVSTPPDVQRLRQLQAAMNGG
jgi:hypothetical protein